MNTSNQSPAKIVVVDDDVDNLRVLTEILETQGYQVKPAINGQLALNAIKKSPPDLILLDIRLPDIQGYDICKQLKANPETHDIPVIFISGLIETVDRMKGFSAGAVDYINKPFQQAEVKARVKTHLILRNTQKKLQQRNIELEQEIIERKRAEQTLQESQKLLEKYSTHLEEMVEARSRALQNAQEQLIKQEKLAMLGQMAGGVAHELRSPLLTISNAVYLLRTVLGDVDANVIDKLDVIARKVQQSDKIISDLLTFSRQQPARAARISVSSLVESALAECLPPAQVQPDICLSNQLPPLLVDPQHSSQILINLITNAYQAMPEGGQLSITAAADQSSVYLSITDTGCGIAPEHLDQIFEPLFTTKSNGIGLGLVVSKRLAKASGGAITVKSEIGAGSTFTLMLPTPKAK